MIQGGMVFVNGNIGIVIDGTFSGDYLVEHSISSNGVIKSIKQWYDGSIVEDYFISEAERDTYYIAHPDFLVLNMIAYVKDVGKLKYTDSVWIIISEEIPSIIDPDIFDVLGERFTGKYDNALDGINIVLNDVKSVETLAFVATVDETNLIDFSSLIGLNLSTATFNLYHKGLRFDKNNYVINADLKSIMLTDWSINRNETVILEYSTKS